MKPSQETHADGHPAGFIGWWRNWQRKRKRLIELRDDIARISNDMGIPANELRVLAAKYPDVGQFLNRRMAALDLTAAELGLKQAGVLRDLQRVCTQCASKRRCARDLDQQPGNPVWGSYCPNAATLTALREQAAVERGVRRLEHRRRIARRNRGQRQDQGSTAQDR